MRSALRIAIVLLGALFTLQGIVWIGDPGREASRLGMPLLEGAARSTQIGDLAAFFLTAGSTILIGARPGFARLLYVPMGLFGFAAAARTLAWALQGAAFTGRFIAIEVGLAALLLAAALRLDREA